MQSAVVFVALLAAASANTVFRVPSHDSAVIKSERNGGNFAYSVAESPAWGVVSPVVSHVTSPVATTYTVQQPTHVVSSVKNIVPQVATTYTVHQPTTHVVASSPVVSNVEVKSVPANSVTYTAVQQPAHQATVVTASGPVVSNVEVKSVPVTNQIATTYGSWPYNYWYGSSAIDASSPIVYNAGNGVEKQINQVHQTVQAVQPVTYSVQQPATTVVASPAATYSVQHIQPFVSGYTPADTVKTANVVAAAAAPWGYSVGYAAGHPSWAWNTNTVVV